MLHSLFDLINSESQEYQWLLGLLWHWCNLLLPNHITIALKNVVQDPWAGKMGDRIFSFTDAINTQMKNFYIQIQNEGSMIGSGHGALQCALALQPILDRILEPALLAKHISYASFFADNGTIIGQLGNSMEIVDQLTTALKVRGQGTKTNVSLPFYIGTSLDRLLLEAKYPNATFTYFLRASDFIPPTVTIAGDLLLDGSLLATAVQNIPELGNIMEGVPIGTKTYVSQYCISVARKALAHVDAMIMKDVPHQFIVKVIHDSLTASLQFLLANVDPEQSHDACILYDSGIQTRLNTLLNINPTNIQQCFINLPKRFFGGMGVRRTTDYSVAAFIVTQVQLRRNINLPYPPNFNSSMRKLNLTVDKENFVSISSLAEQLKLSKQTQKSLVSSVYRKRFNTIVNRLSRSDLIQINCQAEAATSLWMTPSFDSVDPLRATTSIPILTNDEFRVLWIKILPVDERPLLQSDRTDPFPENQVACGLHTQKGIACPEPLDAEGNHRIFCDRCKYPTHNDLQANLQALGTDSEVHSTTNGTMFHDGTRADILFDGLGVIIDVVVKHPLAACNIKNKPDGSPDIYHHLNAAQKKKGALYRSNCKQRGFTFLTFAVSPTGMFGSESHILLKKIAPYYVARHLVTHAKAMKLLKTFIQVRLFKRLATIILDGVKKVDDFVRNRNLMRDVPMPIHLHPANV